MLVVCQLPMSDARALVGAPRLASPESALPQPRRFVRGFGPLETAHAAASSACEETRSASARQAIKLPDLARGAVAPERLAAACEFRRLHCDGVALAHVDIGLRIGSRPRASGPVERIDAQSPLTAVEFDRLIASVLDLPVRVRSLGAPEQSLALHLAGPTVSRLFEQATTATDGAAGTRGFVRALVPTILIEYEPGELGALPEEARALDPTVTGGVPLAYLRREHAGQPGGIWFLGVVPGDPRVVRDLRLALLRIHAEQEGLRHVIALLLDGTITYTRGTREGNCLERYLNRVTTAMPESHPGAMPAKAIASVLNAYQEPVPRGQRALLVQRLSHVKRQITVKLVRYLEAAEQAWVNANAQTPIRVFVSYSHKDHDYVALGSSKSILEYLSGLQREGFVFWHDDQLYASEQWDERIRQEMARADIALVLVSQFFLNSNYITNSELPALLSARQTTGMAMLPLLVSASDWESYPWLSGTQHLPSQGTLRKDYKARGKREELYLLLFKTLRRIGASKRHPAGAAPAGV